MGLRQNYESSVKSRAFSNMFKRGIISWISHDNNLVQPELGRDGHEHSILIESWVWFYLLVEAWVCKLKILHYNRNAEMQKPAYQLC